MADEKIIYQIEIDRSRAEKELEATTKQLVENKQAVTELNKSFKEGLVSTEQYAKESIKLKKSQKELVDQQKLLTKEVSTESNSIDALRLKLISLTKERNSTNQKTKEGAETAAQLTEEIKKVNDAISEQEQKGGDFRRNVGNYGSAFKEAVGGVQVFGTSLEALFKAILTNPIGLIVTGLFALFNILKQNDTIATAFKGVMTGIGVVFDQIAAVVGTAVTQFEGFGETSSEVSNMLKDVGTRILNNLLAPINFFIDLVPAVSKALKGDFKGAADIAGKATKQFGESILFMNDEVPKFVENMSAAVKVGIEYEKALDDIEEKQSKLNVTIGELTNQRDRLKLQSGDLAKSEEERIKLLEQSEAIDERILNERMALLNEEIAVRQKYTDALGEEGTKKEDAEKKIRELQVQRLAFENESLKFQEKAQNKSNSLRQKELDDQEKAQKEKEKLDEDARKKREEEEKRALEATAKLTELRNKQEIEAYNESINNLTLSLGVRMELLQSQTERELEMVDEKYAMLLEKDGLLDEERLLLEEQREEQKNKILEDSANKSNQLIKKQADYEKSINKFRTDSAFEFANNIGDILSTQQEFAEEAAAIQKGIALGEIAVNLQRELSAIATASALNPANAVTAGTAGISQYTIQSVLAIVRAAASTVKVVSQGFADGGYTGPGSKYQPAGIVHAGEVVWSQKDVAMFGGVRAVESIRPTAGYADGGFVTGAINNRVAASQQPVIKTTNMLLSVKDVNKVNNRVSVINSKTKL